MPSKIITGYLNMTDAMNTNVSNQLQYSIQLSNLQVVSQRADWASNVATFASNRVNSQNGTLSVLTQSNLTSMAVNQSFLESNDAWLMAASLFVSNNLASPCALFASNSAVLTSNSLGTINAGLVWTCNNLSNLASISNVSLLSNLVSLNLAKFSSLTEQYIWACNINRSVANRENLQWALDTESYLSNMNPLISQMVSNATYQSNSINTFPSVSASLFASNIMISASNQTATNVSKIQQITATLSTTSNVFSSNSNVLSSLLPLIPSVSNAAIYCSNIASTTGSNLITISATCASASNQTVFTSNTLNMTTQLLAVNTSNFIFASNASEFALNGSVSNGPASNGSVSSNAFSGGASMATFGSNATVWTSNNAIPTSSFSSNTSVFASNLATSTISFVKLSSLALAQFGNSALYASNTLMLISNMIPGSYASNNLLQTAVDLTYASNLSISASNTAFNVYTMARLMRDGFPYIQQVLMSTCNAANAYAVSTIFASNTSVGTSNIMSLTLSNTDSMYACNTAMTSSNAASIALNIENNLTFYTPSLSNSITAASNACVWGSNFLSNASYASNMVLLASNTAFNASATVATTSNTMLFASLSTTDYSNIIPQTLSALSGSLPGAIYASNTAIQSSNTLTKFAAQSTPFYANSWLNMAITTSNSYATLASNSSTISNMCAYASNASSFSSNAAISALFTADAAIFVLLNMLPILAYGSVLSSWLTNDASNYALFPSIAYPSNTIIFASNTANIGSSLASQILSNVNAVSNAAFYALNTSVHASNAFSNVSSNLLFMSNAFMYACNTSLSAKSNALTSSNLIALALNTLNFASNTAIWVSNANSNLLSTINSTSNTAIYSSNTWIYASNTTNQATALYNQANAMFVETCNTSIAQSNLSVWSSNNGSNIGRLITAQQALASCVVASNQTTQNQVSASQLTQSQLYSLSMSASASNTSAWTSNAFPSTINPVFASNTGIFASNQASVALLNASNAATAFSSLSVAVLASSNQAVWSSNNFVYQSNACTFSSNNFSNIITSAPGKNRIINGAMRIDQRNNGALVSGSGSNWAVDMWILTCSQANSTIQQVPSTTPGFSKALCVNKTSTSGTTLLQQVIEASFLSDLAFGTSSAVPLTLSFTVNSSSAANVAVSLNNNLYGTPIVAYVTSIPVSQGWQRSIIQFPGATIGGWNSGAVLTFSLGQDSVAIASSNVGVWASQSSVMYATAASIASSPISAFYITGVQMERGNIATVYENLHIAIELDSCMRQFQKSYDYSNVPGTISQSDMRRRNIVTADTVMGTWVSLPLIVPMHESGNCVLYSPITGSKNALAIAYSQNGSVSTQDVTSSFSTTCSTKSINLLYQGSLPLPSAPTSCSLFVHYTISAGNGIM